jgi:hypothetical protein
VLHSAGLTLCYIHLLLCGYNSHDKTIITVVIIAFLHDSRKVSMNTIIKVFTFAFTWGYGFSFLAEVVATTAVRLGVMTVTEPQAFELTPKVPAIYLPWVLPDHSYIIKPLSKLIFNTLSWCAVGPVVEQTAKVCTFMQYISLP